ncbi:MAG TPA: hypothetical protein VF618_25095 [Thermoanaerobaculia bacterium]
MWEELVWSDYPNGDLEQNFQTSRHRADGHRIRLASVRVGRQAGELQLATSHKPPSQRMIQEWVGCVVGGCIAAAGGCILSGPLPECFILACVAVQIGCTFDMIISNM